MARAKPLSWCALVAVLFASMLLLHTCGKIIVVMLFRSFLWIWCARGIVSIRRSCNAARLEDLRVGRVARLMWRVMQSGSYGCEAWFLSRVASGV